MVNAFVIAGIVLVAVALAALFVRWRVCYRYPPREVPHVLCYHKLSNRFRFEGTWTTPRRFLRQVEHLQRGGYRFIDEDEFLRALDTPRAGDERRVLLTFDDGYRELCDVCTRDLVPRRVPVLVFVVSDYVGRSNDWDLSLGRRRSHHLSAADIAELAGAGVRFGSHGATHRDLTMLADDDVFDELARSRSTLESITGEPVRTLSYPFGRSDARVREAARRAGYAAAFSLYPSHCNETVDRFALRRNGVYVIDTLADIDRKLQRGPLYWLEEMKCRTINGIAVVTPLVKRFSARQDT